MSTFSARSARRYNSRSARTTIIDPPDNELNFRVPSVKLFLSGLRTIKSETQQQQHHKQKIFHQKTFTIDITPSDSLRFNDINKQVSFETMRKPLIKSTSAEVKESYCYYCDNDTESVATPPPFSYDNYCLDQFNNNLSERVLMWLDLAVQNHKEFKNPPHLKKKIIQTAKKEKIIESIVKKPPSPIIQKIEEPIITSEMEYEEIVQANEPQPMKIRREIMKRQLHIFIPNLPKKADSSSMLSSSINSSLLTSSVLNKFL